MERESFIVYKSFYGLIKLLPAKERIAMYEAIFDYGFESTEPSFDGEASKAIWAAIKPQLRANNARWENGCKGAEFGKLGGAPKGNQNARKDKCSSCETTADGLNENADETTDKGLNNVIEETTPKTTPKTTATYTPKYTPKTTPNENENENENVLLYAAKENKNIYLKTGACTHISNENLSFLRNWEVLNENRLNRPPEYQGVYITDKVLESVANVGKWVDYKTLELIVTRIAEMFQRGEKPTNLDKYVSKMILELDNDENKEMASH